MFSRESELCLLSDTVGSAMFVSSTPMLAAPLAGRRAEMVCAEQGAAANVDNTIFTLVHHFSNSLDYVFANFAQPLRTLRLKNEELTAKYAKNFAKGAKNNQKDI